MASIHFSFGPDVSGEERSKTLATIRSWRGIRTASQLKPESRHPITSRLAYATLTSEADIDVLVARLGALSCIETVSVPSRRGIAK